MTSFRDLIQAQAKALGPNPAFEDPGRPVSVVDLNQGRIAGRNPNSGVNGTGPRVAHKSAGRHLQAYGGAQAMDWVMDCTRFMADAVANADYHFEKPQEPTAEKIPAEPVAPPKALFDLMQQPNPYADYIEMMELLVIDLLLVGNAYWMKWRTNEKEQPLAFYRLAPPYVEVTTKPWGIGSYIYQIPNNDKLEIDPREVVHFKLANPDPANPFYGLGLISGAGRAADLEIAITDSQTSYYENATLPSATLKSQRRVPRDVFKKVRAQMRARSQGPKQAGELLVLEAGLELDAISPNAVDAAYLELSTFSKDRCFSWFKMSPKLVGLGDQEGLADAQRQFDTHAARPLMNKIQTKVAKELTMAWDLEYAIDYEYQLSPEQQATMAGTYAKLPAITGHEIRKFAKLPEIKDAKYQEALSAPLNLPGENGGTGQPGEKATRTGHPDPNLPGEPGRPPKRENTKQFPAKGSSAKKPKKSEGKALIEEILALPEEKAEPDPGVPESDTLYERRTTEIDTAVESFESALASAALALEHGLLETAEGKALASDVVTKLRSAEAWKQFTKDAEEAFEHNLVKVMSAAAIQHSELGLQPKAEIDYDKLVKSLIKDKATGIPEIVSTFKTMLATTVKEAKTKDSTVADIHGAIQAAVGDWVGNNAHMIALDQAVRGYNTATLTVAKESGADKVLVSDGTDFDTPCVEANGSVWSVEKAAANLLEHPRCRRAFVPILGTE